MKSEKTQTEESSRKPILTKSLSTTSFDVGCVSRTVIINFPNEEKNQLAETHKLYDRNSFEDDSKWRIRKLCENSSLFHFVENKF